MRTLRAIVSTDYRIAPSGRGGTRCRRRTLSVAGPRDSGRRADAGTGADDRRAADVPVIKPKAAATTNYVELTGNAASVRSVKLIARVDGYLEEQHFHDGAFVKKGDLLFKVQQDQYKAQLLQAQSQVLAAKAALVYARTEVVRYRSW